MSLDLHFRSGSLDDTVLPTPLVDALAAGEIIQLDNLYGLDFAVLSSPSPGPVPGAGLGGLAFLALAGLFARARGLLAK
jgi:hypothetical protein